MIFDITNGGLVYTDATNSMNFSARGALSVTNELRLPNTTSLTYSNISIGVNGAQSNSMLVSRILIGSNSTFNANQFTFAAYRASGSIEARAAGASLKLRASDGTSPVSQVLIGNFSGGPNPTASIGLSNGAVDISATEIIVGKNVANNSSASASFSFSNGSVTANTLVVGNGANAGGVSATNTNVLTATVSQHGGVATISNIVMGRSVAQGASSGPVLDKYTSTYNLNGGTLAAALINTDSTNGAILGMARTIVWTGGTLKNYDVSTDLTITASTAANAAIGLTISGTNAKILKIDSGRTNTFGAAVAVQLNGGTLTVDASSDSTWDAQGRFQIGASGSTPALLSVTNGKVKMSSSSGILGIGDRATNVASDMTVSGGDVEINLTSANRMLVGNKGPSTLTISGGSLTANGNADLFVGGDHQYAAANGIGVLTVAGTSTVTINGTGRFTFGQNSTNSSGVTNSTGVSGTLNLNGGILATSRRITPGTNGTFTATVNLNGGTLRALTNQPDWITVPNLNLLAASTIDSGGFDVGITKNLVGTGKLTKTGTGTLTLSGVNSYAGDTDVNSGALSLLGTVASPNINVAGGAALVLSTAPIGAITNNLVFSSGAKVRVNGTPSGSSVTLLTTSGAISGVPELEANVPGYTLVTSGSTISLQAAEDTVAPLITLRGPNPMTIALGETFTDPGADVADNLDADRLIYGTGMVDGNQAGSYSVTYDASDAAPMAPTPVVRTVNVAKGTPVLSGISASAITEGQSFGDSTITGTAQYNGAEVEGTWAFAGGQTLNGSGTYNVVFYPTDTSNYNSNPGTVSLTVNPAGVSFASWSSGGTTNSELVGKYAIGGASNSAATGEKPVVTLDGNKLSLSAIVRTNDAKLNVVGEAGSGLTNWSTNGVTSTAAGSQAGVSAGCERRVFSVDRTNSPSRQFLRLKATLQP
jgi:autotransporter-associated beta strand protein